MARKEKQINLTIDEKDHKLLKQFAEKKRVSVASLIRLTMLDLAERELKAA